MASDRPVDSHDTREPTRRARPVGVLGAEVWTKLVDADQPTPTDPSALSFLTMTARPGFRAKFKLGDGSEVKQENTPISE